jgi:hypothetical protein
MNADSLRPWPRVKWDTYDRVRSSEALLVMNHSDFGDADSQASHIRSLAERELYRCRRPIDISTGGWCDCLYRAWEHLAGRYNDVAVVTMAASTETATLRGLLAEAGSRWVETDWMAPKNSAVDDVIDRFDDCPDALRDFYRSDWGNLAECYTRDLLRRRDQQSNDIRALFGDYCEAIGATSALQALEGECDSFEDGDDMNAAILNHAMTWAELEVCCELWPED